MTARDGPGAQSGDRQRVTAEQLESDESNPSVGASFLGAVLSAIPAGPADGELLPLSRLADGVRMAVMREVGRDVLPLPLAARQVISALLGDDSHAGSPASRLSVYVRTTTGPTLLAESAVEYEGTRFPSERERRLRSLVVPLVAGHQIEEIEGGAALSVVRDAALAAFGLIVHGIKPAAPALPLHWPPHDASAWGVRSLDATGGASVRRVSDVIRCRSTDEVPIQEAAAAVVDELAHLLPVVSSWFLLQPGKRPTPMAADDEWQYHAPYFYDRDPTSYLEWRWFAASEWTALGGVPSIDGLPGLLECLRNTFSHARFPNDLNNGLAAFIAVPEAVAAAVAGIHQAAPPLAASSNKGLSVALDADEDPRHSVVGRPVANMPSDADLLKEWERMGGQSGEATRVLAKRYGVNRSTIQRRLKRVNSSSKPPKVVATVFEMGKARGMPSGKGR